MHRQTHTQVVGKYMMHPLYVHTYVCVHTRKKKQKQTVACASRTFYERKANSVNIERVTGKDVNIRTTHFLFYYKNLSYLVLYLLLHLNKL